MTMIPVQYAGKPTFSFGDTTDMANSGACDVVARKQTATCGALTLLSANPETMPREGMVEVVLDGYGNAVCAIKTWKTDIVRFQDIDENFAKAEACLDLHHWREIHESYFRRRGCFSEDMKLVRQYFEVLEVFSNEHKGWVQ